MDHADGYIDLRTGESNQVSLKHSSATVYGVCNLTPKKNLDRQNFGYILACKSCAMRLPFGQFSYFELIIRVSTPHEFIKVSGT